ncbi:MAG: trigger factor [Bacillaceae bacterium]|nr:trigger factor [Bacillaceae bacterium]
MKANWEKQENNQGILTVEVDTDQVDRALDQAFKKVVKKVNVPGFRKGKVPRKLFEARFGVESLYQDALDILLPEAYSQAVEETGIEPVDRPEVDIEQMEKGQPLVFKATVTVKPEPQLGQYKGLEVEEKDFSVKPEDIDEELKKMQERQGELEVVEEGELQNGDHAIIDFEGFKDGEPFEGGKGEKFDLEIGSGTFIPGFEDQLVGMKPGEEKEIEVTFPEEYHAEELAGQPVTFKVKLHEIKRLNLPELDDEFARDVSEFDTLDELKEDIKNKLEEKAEQDAENYKREAVIEKATENTTIDLPDVMVENEVDQMVQEFAQRLQMQGMTLDIYYQYAGLNEEQLREQFKEDAEKRVRTRLTLEAIAEAENIEVTEEDVEEELKKLAEMYSRDVEEIRKIFMVQDGMEGVKNDIKIRKTIDLLVENSKPAA